MDWERVKETARVWYFRAAQFYMFQTLVLYLVACMAAGEPISIGKYAAFVNHLFSFR